MELLVAPLGEADRRHIEPSIEPALEIQFITEDPKEIALREGIHERIQA